MQVITINQDELGKQGAPVWSNCPTFEPCAARPPPATHPLHSSLTNCRD